MVKFAWTFALLALIAGVVLPALPAEGQGLVTSFRGTANGIDREDRLGVRIVGRFTPVGGPAFPCGLSATLIDVISDTASDVTHPANIPLNLSKSTATTCTYESLSTPPFVRLLVGDVADGANTFNFRLQVTQGTYLPGPIACAGKVTLVTHFRLNGPNIQVPDPAPAGRAWVCFGTNNRYLKTP